MVGRGLAGRPSGVLLLVILAFLTGVGFGSWYPGPVKTARAAVRQMMGAAADTAFFRSAFVDPVVPAAERWREPVADREAIAVALDSLTVPADYFFEADSALAVVSAEYETDRLVVRFRIRDYSGSGYAYAVPGKSAARSCGILLIPGSGHNQGKAILEGAGYHGGIAGSLSELCDLYVQVKPNEDSRAIHNGAAKLGGDFIYARLLNAGGSYSATYLLEARALADALDRRYAVFGIAGLSQGAEAALMVALTSEPSFAIVSSGFSVLQRRLPWAGFNQIIIPGLYRRLPVQRVAQIMAADKTDYLLSYGGAEGYPFGIEARTQASCTFFTTVGPGGIRCVVHDGGHSFPTDSVLSFIRDMLPDPT